MNKGELKPLHKGAHFLRLRDGNLFPLNVAAYAHVPIPHDLVDLDMMTGIVVDLTHGPSEDESPPGEFVCGD